MGSPAQSRLVLAEAVSLGHGPLGSAPSVTGLASGEIDVAWPASGHAAAGRVTYTPAAGWGGAR